MPDLEPCALSEAATGGAIPEDGKIALVLPVDQSKVNAPWATAARKKKRCLCLLKSTETDAGTTAGNQLVKEL